YRVAVVPIHLVPLRQRKEEIPLLVQYFVEQHNQRLRLRIEGVEPDAMRLLVEYSWPGNVRELENGIERAMVLASGSKITVADLPSHIVTPVPQVDGATDLSMDDLSVKKHSAALERRLIIK